MDLFIKGKSVPLTLEGLLDNAPQLNNNMDFNSLSDGIYKASGVTPVNGPDTLSDFSSENWFGTFQLSIDSDTKIQVIITYDLTIYIRSHGGSSHVWNSWKQIGGVLKALHKAVLSHLPYRKVVA